MSLAIPSTKSKKINYLLILMIFSIALYFTGISTKRLWRTDEPRVAGISAEMAFTGDYFMPKLNGKPFLEYPPMYYWVTSSFYNTMGRSPFTSRLASGIAAVLGILLIYLLTKRMGFSSITAFFSGVVLASTAEYWALANRCLVDMLLCFFVIFAMYSFFKLHQSLNARNGFLKAFSWMILFAVTVGCGILTKNLLGIVLPGIAIFFWLIIENIANKKSFWKSWITFILGCVISFVLPGLWLFGLYKTHGFQMVHTVIWKNTIERFTGDYSQHSASIFYYFEHAPVQFMPWTILLGLIIIYLIVFKKKIKVDANMRFALAWFIFPFIFLTISDAKRPVYLLPLYPALALIVVIASNRIVKSNEFLGKLNWKRYIHYVAILLFIVFLVVEICIAAMFNHKNSFYPMFKYYEHIKGTKNVYLYMPDEAFEGAANYYLYKEVPVLKTENDVKNILNRKDTYIFSETENLPAIKPYKTFKIKRELYSIYSNN